MNYEALFLFLILLSALILCSFLGGNCREGFTTNSYTTATGGKVNTVTTASGNKYVGGTTSSGTTYSGSNVNGKRNYTTYDNYNHYSGTSYPTTYYGPSGTTAKLVQTGFNNYIVVTNSTGGTDVYYLNASSSTTDPSGSTTTASPSSQVYYGPNGATAQIISTGTAGEYNIQVSNSSGQITLYSSTQPTGAPLSTTTDSTTPVATSTSAPVITTSSASTSASASVIPSGTTYYGPNGATAVVSTTSGVNTISITINGVITVYTANTPSAISGTIYYGPNGGTATIYTDNNGNYAVKLVDQYGVTTVFTIQQTAYGGTTVTTVGTSSPYYAGTNYDSSAYYNSLPAGIPASQIPAGQQDLYILKSQVVPPVCPRCNDTYSSSGSGNWNSSSSSSGSSSDGSSSSSSDNSQCPPCPACARCEYPPFECKKVPTYSSFSSDSMPVPVLNDFSSFGM